MEKLEKLSDDFLFGLDNPMDIVAQYVPANYTPNQEQAKRLVEVAIESTIRWYELQSEWNATDQSVINCTQEQFDYYLGRINQKKAQHDL